MIKPSSKIQKSKEFYDSDKENEKSLRIRILPNSNKGVSPVIATVILIVMVIVIGLIVFTWVRGFTQEAVTKFDKNVALVCGNVKFESSYSGGILTVSNIGNVPIYEMKIKFQQDKSYETKDLNKLSKNWPSAGLNPGRIFSDNMSISAKSITLTPVLIGNTKSGKKSYVCDELRYGKKITI